MTPWDSRVLKLLSIECERVDLLGSRCLCLEKKAGLELRANVRRIEHSSVCFLYFILTLGYQTPRYGFVSCPEAWLYLQDAFLFPTTILLLSETLVILSFLRTRSGS